MGQLSMFTTTDRAGLVVVSKDDSFDEILGYVDKNKSISRLPDGFRWWAEAMDACLSSQLQNGTTRRAKAAYKPTDYFLTSTWGQDFPYNAKCPSIDGKLPPCGCVATATSQVLRYYRYPEAGTGYGTYVVGTAMPHPDKIFSTYNWDLMPDSCVNGEAEDPSVIDAVSTLVYEVGLAASMVYDLQGSSAMYADMTLGLARNFGYCENALRCYRRDFFSSDEWMEMIYRCIEQKLPVLYGGNDKRYGGHAFVLDGIDADGLVHVNWGWDGDYDGYYNIEYLNPNGMAFAYGQDVILGLKPYAQPTEEDVMESYICMQELFTFASKVSLSRQISLSLPVIYNLYFKRFDGDIAINVVNVDDETECYEKSIVNGSVSVESLYGLESKTSPFWRITTLKEGAYKVFLTSQDKNEPTKSIVRAPEGMYGYTINVDSKGMISVADTLVRHASVWPPDDDAIQSVLADKAPEVKGFYNLAGQSVARPAKGIYIQNGRKVLVK